MATVGNFLFLVVYLVVASTMLSMITTSVEGITIGNFGFSAYNETNFSELTNISSINGVVTDGSFTLVQGTGLVSTGQDLNRILFTQLNQSEGWINSTYHIGNPLGREHAIIIYYQNILNSIYVLVDDTGFWFITAPVADDFYQYEDAHLIAEYNITVAFDTVNEWCIVTLDTTEIFNQEAPISITTGLFEFVGQESYFGGLSVLNSGLQLKSLSSSLSIQAEESDFSIFEVLGIMVTLLLWNVDASVIPIWMNIIFIKIPGLGLLFVGVQLLRGAG